MWPRFLSLDPRWQDPHQETRLGRKGLHRTGRSWEGKDGKEGQLLALFPSHWGLELFFGTICKISLEEGGGGAGDLGFFS